MLLISFQVFCMYCVSSEHGQVGRNMSQEIQNSEKNKIVFCDWQVLSNYFTVVFRRVFIQLTYIFLHI